MLGLGTSAVGLRDSENGLKTHLLFMDRGGHHTYVYRRICAVNFIAALEVNDKLLVNSDLPFGQVAC